MAAVLDVGDLPLKFATVPRHMGVVLHNVEIVTGRVYKKTMGAVPIGAEEARVAVRVTAINADGHVNDVPGGGGSRSLGRSAPAASNRPGNCPETARMLFDEAMSGLDHLAQAVVQASLKRFGFTRVVIPHRLSSIRDVDRINVLEAGRIFE